MAAPPWFVSNPGCGPTASPSFTPSVCLSSRLPTAATNWRAILSSGEPALLLLGEDTVEEPLGAVRIVRQFGEPGAIGRLALLLRLLHGKFALQIVPPRGERSRGIFLTPFTLLAMDSVTSFCKDIE